jgi:hypothetical protein
MERQRQRREALRIQGNMRTGKWVIYVDI